MVDTDFKNIRLVLGFSQEQMADNLGISPAYIKKLECGAMPVSRKVLERLNDFLNEKYPDLVQFAECWDEIKYIYMD